MDNKYIFCHPKYLKLFVREVRQDYETDSLLLTMFLKIMSDHKVFEQYYSSRPHQIVWEITRDGNDPIPF